MTARALFTLALKKFTGITCLTSEVCALQRPIANIVKNDMRSNRMVRQDNARAEAGFAAGPDMFTILIGFGCLLLWINEGWAIKTHRSLNEAQVTFVSLPDATVVGREYDNRLLHFFAPNVCGLTSYGT